MEVVPATNEAFADHLGEAGPYLETACRNLGYNEGDFFAGLAFGLALAGAVR